MAIGIPAPPLLALEARRLIHASCEQVFAHLMPPEHLVRYGAPFWMVAEPGEKRGAVHTVTFRGYFVGLPVESVQRVAAQPPSSLEFSQVRGTLRRLAGAWTVQNADDGTELACRLEADPGIPLITERTAQQFLVQFLERMLDRIKLAAERRPAVRRAPRGAIAAATALPGAAEAAEDDEGPPVQRPRPAPPAGGAAHRRRVVGPVAESPSSNAAGRDRTTPARQGGEAASRAPHGKRRRRRKRHHGGPSGGGSAPA